MKIANVNIVLKSWDETVEKKRAKLVRTRHSRKIM
jgi:hypothetical protein